MSHEECRGERRRYFFLKKKKEKKGICQLWSVCVRVCICACMHACKHAVYESVRVQVMRVCFLLSVNISWNFVFSS